MYTFHHIKTDGLSDFKKDILSMVTEKDIIEYYIDSKLPSGKILSPFRKENNPSFSFMTTNNGIVWTDWGNGDTGDAFLFVMRYYNCNFPECLHYINRDMLLGIGDDTISINTKNMLIGNFKPIEGNTEKEIITIIIKNKRFSINDYNYWGQYGVSISTLREFRVSSVENVWLKKESIGTTLVRQYTENNPVYAYEFIEDGKSYYKVYSPYSDRKSKWISNIKKHMIEGYDSLPLFGELLILTKSLKDVMCLYELGYSAISFHSESSKITHNDAGRFLKRFNRILVLYDNDSAGILGANKIKEEFRFSSIIIPKETGCKDISDYYKEFGRNNSVELLKQLI